MSRDAFDRQLRDALRSDADRASREFTDTVLEHVRRTRRRRATLPARRALAAAAVTLAIVAGITTWRTVDSGDSSPSRERARRELLEEYREIEAELDEIRSLARDADPVLYLGGDESFDLIYDLEGHISDARGGIRPAARSDRG